MKQITVTDERRDGKTDFGDFDMVGVFIDRFGKDISIRKINAERSYILVDIAISRQFFGWIFSLGTGVKITGPEAVVDVMRQAAAELSAKYEGWEKGRCTQ